MKLAYYAIPPEYRTDWKERLFRFMEELMFALLAEELVRTLSHI
jgi:hypothetical protein